LFGLPAYRWVQNFGMIGVDLFFIISGYLITRSFDRLVSRHGSGKAGRLYTIHRVFRILPAYYLNLGVVILLYALTTDPAHIFSNSFIRQIIHHVFLTSYLFAKDCGFGFNGAYWTLSIEMIWYIAAVFLSLYCRRVRMIAALMIASIGYVLFLDLGWFDAWLGLDPAAANYMLLKYFWAHQFPGQFFFFGIGILWHRYANGRDFSFLLKRVSEAPRILLYVMLVAILVPTGKAGMNFISMKYLMSAVAVSFVFIAFYIYSSYASRTLAWFGKISYSLYLWHFPLIKIGVKMHAKNYLSMPELTILFIASLLLISSFSYYFVEEMGFVMRDRLSKRFHGL
jgi:peptidoglycan/LPS O-acetylase OafA/YrhL